jgi:hypothetical protein
LVGYSPLVRLYYAGLKPEDYTLKVWLLEEQNYHLASTQWSPRTIPIRNGKDGLQDVELRIVTDMDVFDYPSFLWVARLYDRAGLEVASATARSKAVPVRPALLKPVGARVATVGQPLRFNLESDSDAEAGARTTYRMQGAPAGATLDPKTGAFDWTPSAAGRTTVFFEALAGGSDVADAASAVIDVSAPDPLEDR